MPSERDQEASNKLERELTLAVGNEIFNAGFVIVDLFQPELSTPSRPVFAEVADIHGEREAVTIGASVLEAHRELAEALYIDLPTDLQERVVPLEAKLDRGERNRRDSRLAVAERMSRKDIDSAVVNGWLDIARGT